MSAPKGNRYAEAKIIYKTVEQLQEAIDEYFYHCDNRLVQGYDNKTNEQFAYIFPAPYTMSGLARTLGISRQCLSEYSHREKYGDAIRAAREKVHEDIETRLMEKQAVGAIFNLKNNFGWKDQTEQKQSGELEIKTKRTEEELNAIIAEEFNRYAVSKKGKIGLGNNGKKIGRGK